jgi:hypothetical protein
MLLIKSLPRIAARVLHNTRGVPQSLKFKFELIATAYGAATVERDFEEWCREHVEDKFPYPITEYVKVIDSRLGGAPETKRADLNDPKVGELSSLTYEITGVLPPKSAVAQLLAEYPFDEVKAALDEFSEKLTESDVKRAMREFYSSGGAVAVVLARRRRAQIGR